MSDVNKIKGKSEKMGIVITGGAGFIGSNLARFLKDQYKITIIDNRKDLDAIDDFKNEINFIGIDILNYQKVSKVIQKADGIIHLAAVSRVIWGYEDPFRCITTNVVGTANILEATRKSNKKPWIIFGSSREVYGENGKLPLNENAPYKSANIYSASKISAELICEKFSTDYGLSIGISRFSNVYGGIYDILDRVIPRFILSAIYDEIINIHGGDQLFDFTHISDTIIGIAKLVKKLEEGKSFFDKFHFLTGVPSSLQDIVNLLQRNLNKKLEIEIFPPRSYDVMKFYGNPIKSKETLDFTAKIRLEEGIQKTLQLYLQELKNNRELFESRMVWRK